MAINGLDKITDKILSEAQAKADRIIASAQTECDGISARYAEKADAIRDSLSADAEREGKDYISRAKSTAATARRNLLLATQSEIIDDVFETAHKGVRNLTPEKYTGILAGLLSAAFLEQMETEKVSRELYGEEDAAAPEAYEVLMNQRDREAYGKEVIEATRKKLINKVPAEKLELLSLADDTAQIDGGLVLRYGDVESNCSLSIVFTQLRAELEAEVSHALFDARVQE